MIVWLASYPRSGNTLLRTILRQCFHLYSYADEPVDYESEFRSNPDMIGHVEHGTEWADFYPEASASDAVYLVKTHAPPIDAQPFIYIVRDGRSAIVSYQAFNRNFNGLDMPLTHLISGMGGYGGWSDHYHRWNGRNLKRAMMMRYEELVHISDDHLLNLSYFLDFRGDPKKWVNPVEQLKTVEPGFFGVQRQQFQGDAGWTLSHEYLFRKIHGGLMTELGYYSADAPDTGWHPPEHADSMLTELAALIMDLQQENASLNKVCGERLALINQLQGVCEERLGLIHQLHDRLNP